MSDKLKEMIEEEVQNILTERLQTFAFEIMSKIGKEVKDIRLIDLWSKSDGYAGLYRYEKDGYAYEIEIRPVKLSKNKDMWKKRIEKKRKTGKVK